MGKAWKNEKVEATKYNMECLRPCSDALRHVFEHDIKMTAADRELKHAPKTALEHWQLHASTGFHLRSLSPSLATHMAERISTHAASGGRSDAVGGGGVRRN